MSTAPVAAHVSAIRVREARSHNPAVSIDQKTTSLDPRSTVGLRHG